MHDFAGLPGLLSRLPAEEVLSEPEDQPEPPSLLLPVLQRVRAERRARRWRAALVGAAAACVAAVGSVVVVDAVDRPPAQEQAAAPIAFTPGDAGHPGLGGGHADRRARRHPDRHDLPLQRPVRRPGAQYVLLMVPKSGPAAAARLVAGAVHRRLPDDRGGAAAAEPDRSLRGDERDREGSR